LKKNLNFKKNLYPDFLKLKYFPEKALLYSLGSIALHSHSLQVKTKFDMLTRF